MAPTLSTWPAIGCANGGALFDEFRETGMSKKMGYNSVGGLRANYPDFCWNTV